MTSVCVRDLTVKEEMQQIDSFVQVRMMLLPSAHALLMMMMITMIRMGGRCVYASVSHVREALVTQGEIPVGSTPAEAEQMLKQEWGKWGGILRAAKMSIDH